MAFIMLESWYFKHTRPSFTFVLRASVIFDSSRRTIGIVMQIGSGELLRTLQKNFDLFLNNGVDLSSSSP